MGKAVAYDRLILRADKINKLPTKIECMAEAGMLIKTLNFKEVKDFGGGIIRPSVIETDSPFCIRVIKQSCSSPTSNREISRTTTIGLM